ncbi:hypothetical protein [Mucilaginibacter myungsuensis]|uniref:Uncharacterized protein n=1 Tax=Mucilaginibacter myungsuensis TaxID=649104 RepID=A0A929KYF3_9SPHI|nr:hypothetical protein [Mucilaginibacter myungsuensis]MBE9663462.1 hypothetical protein [Mucilaginibacter myungsuensis]MDN3600200.1 hypothetical protein [Mucilaginibacter myungsuensis]
MNRIFFTGIIVTLNLITFTCIAQAQKLPSKQTNSLRAPADIKIDGKATEWKDQLQAYNDAVSFSYTLSNNDNELFLTVRCALPSVVRRIMNGAISLNIYKSGQKTEKDPISITYPLFEGNTRFRPQFFAPKPHPGGVVMFPPPQVVASEEPPLKDPIPDSLLEVNNTKFAALAKVIGIKGIPGLDAQLSVYNDDGIKAAGRFDNLMVYTYELSVSLKHLGLKASDAHKFLYQLKINDVEPARAKPVNNGRGGTSYEVTADTRLEQPATFFWADYILAK